MRRSLRTIIGVLALTIAFAPSVPAFATTTALESCSAFTAKLTSTPAIPPHRDPKKVKPVFALVGKLSHCSGPQTGPGAVSFKKKITTGTNCDSGPEYVTVSEAIKWKSGKVSTVSVKMPVKADTDKFDGTVRSGALKGSSQSARLRVTQHHGDCVRTPLKAVNYALVKNVNFILK